MSETTEPPIPALVSSSIPWNNQEEDESLACSQPRRKRRWDSVAPPSESTGTIESEEPNQVPSLKRRNRWGDSAVEKPPPSVQLVPDVPLSISGPTEVVSGGPVLDKKSKALALQASIAARLAALKSKNATPTVTSTRNPPQETNKVHDSSSQQQQQQQNYQQQPIKKAKVYDWDVNITTPLARQKQMEEEKKLKPLEKLNPYLSHVESIKPSSSSSNDVTKPILSSNHTEPDPTFFDSRLAGGTVVKHRARNKAFHFIEPGTYQALAQRKREKEAHAIESGFVSGRKLGTFIQSKGIVTTTGDEQETHYYGQSMDVVSILAPRADAPEESMDGSTATSGGVVVIPMPLVMEWWDVELLPGKLKKEVIARESRALMDSLGKATNKKKANWEKMDKTVVKEETGVDSNILDTHMQEVDKTKNDSRMQKMSEDPVDDQDMVRLRQKCYLTASIFNAKTSSLIQHPVPVIPTYLRGKDSETPLPTLYLTKKERKRQRKLRRAERLREVQDMQAVGLIPAPEPRLTLSNFIKVLGDQAILDPSKMEAKVLEQMQARKLKHEKMNAELKLTDEQRKLKKTKKLMKDDAMTSDVITVALFLVKDMSHRYHRTKVDLNAQQNQITGGVLECASPGFSLVICEGGSRAIRRYTRLMLERMKWKGENMVDNMDSDTEESNLKISDGTTLVDEASPGNEIAQKFNPDNYCELVWTGMAAKRMFNTFAFQSCASAESARKVLEAKGVAHFWDQVVTHASRMGETFNFRLG